MILRLTHDRDSSCSNSSRAEKQRLNFRMSLFLSCRLGVARKGITCVVDYDIEMDVLTEVLSSSSESSVDRSDGSHVQCKL